LEGRQIALRFCEAFEAPGHLTPAIRRVGERGNHDDRCVILVKVLGGQSVMRNPGIVESSGINGSPF
jgi:hypothetical protein